MSRETVGTSRGGSSSSPPPDSASPNPARAAADQPRVDGEKRDPPLPEAASAVSTSSVSCTGSSKSVWPSVSSVVTSLSVSVSSFSSSSLSLSFSSSFSFSLSRLAMSTCPFLCALGCPEALSSVTGSLCGATSECGSGFTGKVGDGSDKLPPSMLVLSMTSAADLLSASLFCCSSIKTSCLKLVF